jgi:hypothetical protein
MLLMKPELVENIDSIDGLRAAVQSAIELEHSTIPPYLYALYSLGSDNKDIAGIIQSVVVEEMGHFGLAANILNAIGGDPCIDKPEFIPTYPGHLPGTVESGLVVPLERFSPKHTKDVFMVIEEPEHPLAIQDAAAQPPLTIGMFYGRIQKAITGMGEGIFTQDPARMARQIEAYPSIVKITNVETATDAIESIVEQGEGTSRSPFDPLHGDELAHYYRFGEIVHGKALVKDPTRDPPFSYSGQAVTFDPGKVTPVIANPKAAGYPAGSAARYGCDTFNYSYKNLLKVLHDTFNGNPSRLNVAIGMMESLNEQALTLMTIDSGLGGKAGPSFEYQPTNP